MRKFLLIGASAFVLGAGTMAYIHQAAAGQETVQQAVTNIASQASNVVGASRAPSPGRTGMRR